MLKYTTMRRKVNTQQKSVGPKERIVTAAVKLFASHGYAGTGMRELSTEAAVNLAMINYFFGSKKGLLKEILDTFYAKYLEIAQRELEQEGPLQEKLERFIHGTVLFFDTYKDYLLVAINELPHDDPEILEHKAAWAQKMIVTMEREICRPLAAERGNVISPTVLAPLLTATMASRFLFAPVVDQMCSEKNPMESLDEYSETISRSLLKMIS